MSTSHSIIAAARDQALRDRLIALAAERGIPNAQYWIDGHLHELAAADVNDTGDTIASVYEYALTVYDQAVKALPKQPGDNPAAVTDDHLRYAINDLYTAETGGPAETAA